MAQILCHNIPHVESDRTVNSLRVQQSACQFQSMLTISYLKWDFILLDSMRENHSYMPKSFGIRSQKKDLWYCGGQLHYRGTQHSVEVVLQGAALLLGVCIIGTAPEYYAPCMKLMHNCQRVSQVLLWQTKHSHSQSIWLHCQNHFQKSHPFHFLTQYIQRMRKH